MDENEMDVKKELAIVAKILGIDDTGKIIEDYSSVKKIWHCLL